MEKKKVGLDTFLGIVFIIVVGVLVCYLIILSQKENNANTKVKQLEDTLYQTQTQLQTVQEEKKELEEKVEAINNVVSGTNKTAPKAFSSSDLVMNDVKVGNSYNQVVNILGEPESKNEYIEGISGEDVKELKYDNGNTTVVIRSDKVVSIDSSNSERTFTRGIKIGMTKTEVTKLFSDSSNVTSDTLSKNSLVYAEKSGDDYKYSSYIRFDFENNKVASVYLSSGDLD